MSTRREIADAARVIEHPDGSREIWWEDGVARRYSREAIALMFLEAIEKGTTNPILERLTTAAERKELYDAAVTLSEMDMPAIVAAGDTTL